MLSGCPECGGNKFQFLPSDSIDVESSQSPEHADSVTAGTDASESTYDSEDRAQASARRTVVSSDELPRKSETAAQSSQLSAGDESGEPPSTDPDEISTETDEQPSMNELREQLNDQFESIKILQPGEYELNLMELYNREEYIIALEEDGRYVIDVPSTWEDPPTD